MKASRFLIVAALSLIATSVFALEPGDEFISKDEYKQLLNNIYKIKVTEKPIKCDGRTSNITHQEWLEYQSWFIKYKRDMMGQTISRGVEYGLMEKKHTTIRFDNFTFANSKGERTLCVGSEFAKMKKDNLIFTQKKCKCKCEEGKND